MNPTSLSQIAAWCSGRLVQPRAGESLISSLGTDTRRIDPGSLFVALRGERFNAHEFLSQAQKGGCAAALVEEGKVGSAPKGLILIAVRDTLDALQEIAAGYRSTLTSPVIAVTGSSGKTSTKELLRAALSPLGRIQATYGNLNNHIGLPLTVLDGDDRDAAHVWEMGMNHPGEIAPLASIARPDAGVIVNIGTAHIEHMGSHEAIAREKGELLAALPESGLAVLPADDEFVELLAELAPCRCVRAGFDAEANYRVLDFHPHADGSSFVLQTPSGEVSVRLSAPGRHMAANASLAVAVAVELCGLEPAQVTSALADARLRSGRLTMLSVGGIRVLDDSYNANPESTAAALRVLAETPGSSGQNTGRRIAVLGRMGELGDHEQPAYRRLADLASELEIDVFHVVGKQWGQALSSSRHPFELHLHLDASACAGALLADQRGGDTILVKGSRSAAMERVVRALVPEAVTR